MDEKIRALWPKLPHFTVAAIGHEDDEAWAEGQFEDMRASRANGFGYLVTEGARVIHGYFTPNDSEEQSVRFALADEVELALIHVGGTYAYLDCGWGDDVALALDETRHWVHTEFHPRDAVAYNVGGHRMRGPVGQEPTFEYSGEPEFIKDGWEHEHCAICWETIAEFASPWGWLDQNGTWVCETCYTQYVQPRSLGFINDIAIAQRRGETPKY